MSSLGVKRTRSEIEHEEAASKGGLPYGDVGTSGRGASNRKDEKPLPKKPKDWREAFLDDDDVEGSRRHGGGSRIGREREDARDRHHDRDYRDRRSGEHDRHRNGAHRDDRRDGRYAQHDRALNSSRERDRRGDSYRHRDHGEANAGSDARYSSSSKREHDRYAGADRRASPSKRDHRGRGDGHGTSMRPRTDEEEEGEIPDYISTYSHKVPRSTSIAPAPVPADIGKPAPNQPSTENTTTAVADAEPEQPVDLEAALDERRRRRRELLEKFSATQSGVASTATSEKGGIDSALSSGKTSSLNGLQTTASRIALESFSTTPIPVSATTDVDVFDHLSKQDQADLPDVLPFDTQAPSIDGENQISAADYNPLEIDDDRSHQVAAQQEIQQSIIASGVGEPGPDVMDIDDQDEYEEVEVEEEDEEFDMFAEEAAPKQKKKVLRKKQKAATVPVPKTVPSAPVVDVSTLIDNFDDHEGYYRITPGEILDGGKYQVTVNLGKGMFSAVIRAKVLKATEKGEIVGGEVAIKVIRSQESMYVAGRKEAGILNKLCTADPEDKKHIVRLFRTFEHRGHLCLVTESLSMNLRDVVKRFGKDVGLNMRAVRAYAHQMFLALSLMKKCNIVHADIKPDNILVTENKAVLKVCDLGSACDASESDITPYLVSRFYRAPEIILGLPYDESLDMWSIGCTLYELYTGKILFPGRSNNHMLLLMMDLKGKFNHKMIKKAEFGSMHFDEGINFISVEKDKITGNDITKTVIITKAARELRSRLLPSSTVQLKMKEEDIKLLVAFVDLLDKCLALDPAKRISAKEALLHPFLSSP